ncbi:MAG TPA: DUF1343 domain-containing protein [Planctomycetaceae bacterium]|nr:DUF1343 domain-containing protein [Planctomycetaceae bacterium]
MRVGLEVLLDRPPEWMTGARLGLLMNQASVDWRGRYACDLVADAFSGRLEAIFSPQHGLWCEEQDNMIETPHGVYRRLGIPVYSLYSDTRRPTAEMLEKIDCLLVDLQDVGTRVYTFVWTVSHCLEACAEVGVPVVVLDRPNPLGGDVFEGPLLDPAFVSFVGRAAIPMRHGLTLGELARLIDEELGLGAELRVIPMQGWRRSMLFPATGRSWVAPSPNMPRFETAVVYPGAVLFEGTNLSEGRGTTTPFELVGAPYIDPFDLADALAEYPTPGLVVRPVRFRPTFNKWADESCGGVAWGFLEARAVRSYTAALSILACVRQLYPAHFAWSEPPYEYETVRMPIDIVSGRDQLRRSLDEGHTSPQDVRRLAELDVDAWRDRAARYFLYPP